MSRPQIIALAAGLFIVAYLAVNLVTRMEEGRCRVRGFGRHGLDCTGPPSPDNAAFGGVHAPSAAAARWW